MTAPRARAVVARHTTREDGAAGASSTAQLPQVTGTTRDPARRRAWRRRGSRSAVTRPYSRSWSSSSRALRSGLGPLRPGLPGDAPRLLVVVMRARCPASYRLAEAASGAVLRRPLDLDDARAARVRRRCGHVPAHSTPLLADRDGCRLGDVGVLDDPHAHGQARSELRCDEDSSIVRMLRDLRRPPQQPRSTLTAAGSRPASGGGGSAARGRRRQAADPPFIGRRAGAPPPS